MQTKDEDLGKLYSFNELYRNGVRVGDIIARKSNKFECGTAWEYVLIREGFPNEYNTALCCYRDPRYPEKVNLSQIGFHWCGEIYQKFRMITESEHNDFINACIKRLKEPHDKKPFGWDIPEYSQIFGALVKYNLINYFEAVKLNKELKKIHKTDLLAYYHKIYYKG